MHGIETAVHQGEALAYPAVVEQEGETRTCKESKRP